MRNQDIFYISPNKLKIWFECPRKYWYFYINPPTRYLDVKKPYFSLGEAVHNTLNTFFAIVPGIRTKERLMGMFEVHWRSVINQEGGFSDLSEEESFKKRAIKMIERFYERENTKIIPFQLSPHYTKYIPLSEKIFVGGKVDRIDQESNGSLHIIDYKTGLEDRDNPFQLVIYDILVRGWLKKDVSKLSYLHLESGNWSTTSSNKTSRQEMKSMIIDTVKNIPRENDINLFNCSLGKKCFHLDYLMELGIKPVL